MFKRLELSFTHPNGKWETKEKFINLDLVTEFDVNSKQVFLIDGNHYSLTDDSMKELVKALEKPSAEERIATALESALDGDGFYCKCLVSNV